MIKRILAILMALSLSLAFSSCGEEEDTYSFFDAASQKEVSQEVSSSINSDEEEVSSAVLNSDGTPVLSTVVSGEQLEVTDTQLQKDKYAIEKVANDAMKALLEGDVEGIKKAQPKLYDSFLDNEFMSMMFVSMATSFKEEFGEDIDYSVEVTEISAGTTADIVNMQTLVDSFDCDLEVETVRVVILETEIEGSLSSENSEEEILAFFAGETWYLAVFEGMDTDMFEGFDPSMFEGMMGDMPDDLLNDMIENMPR